MKRDVPISLADPMVHFYNEDVWKNLGELAGISNKFTALEIKAFYIVGLLYEIFQCVELLLQSEDAWETKYLPAFSLFASGIDLFGRCLAGNSTFDLNSNLAIGFYYLVNHSAVIPPKGISTPDQRKNCCCGDKRCEILNLTLDFDSKFLSAWTSYESKHSCTPC